MAHPPRGLLSDKYVENTCEECGGIFKAYIKKNARFCSRKCQNATSRITAQGRENQKKATSNYDRERWATDTEYREKMLTTVNVVGEGNPNWTGDYPSYSAVHAWISNNFGKANMCENCNTKEPGTRYEWANLSGKYARKGEDFVQLCKKCHTWLDRTRGIWEQLLAKETTAARTSELKQLVADTLEPEQVGGHFVHDEVKEFAKQQKEFIDRRIAALQATINVDGQKEQL